MLSKVSQVLNESSKVCTTPSVQTLSLQENTMYEYHNSLIGIITLDSHPTIEYPCPQIRDLLGAALYHSRQIQSLKIMLDYGLFCSPHTHRSTGSPKPAQRFPQRKLS